MLLLFVSAINISPRLLTAIPYGLLNKAGRFRCPGITKESPSRNPPLNPPANVLTVPPDKIRIQSDPISLTKILLFASIVIPVGV